MISQTVMENEPVFLSDIGLGAERVVREPFEIMDEQDRQQTIRNQYAWFFEWDIVVLGKAH